jgi:DNA mismatch endonuclease (patch repair protein)
MRAVKATGTSPELLVRRILYARGFRDRLHRADLPGCPDIVLSKRKCAIFVNGCFWHGHNCSRGSRVPKTNRGYWQQKIARNVERDGKTLAALRAMKWNAIIVWECELKNSRKVEAKLRRFLLYRP